MNKIEATNSIGLIVDFANITYSQKPDNYALNPDYTDLDKYLPIFGQFSDLLPEAYVEDSKKADGSQLSHKFTYGLDNDGYVTWEQIEHSAGNGSPKWYDSAILQYSSNWQGI